MTEDSVHSFEGLYYDGRSARAYPVTCRIMAGVFHVEGEGIARAEAVVSVSLSDALGSAPRKLTFADGACVEARVTPELIRALGPRGATWVARLEAHWRYAIVALVVTAAVVAAGYKWGLPAFSKVAAYRVPASAMAMLDKQTIEMLDKEMAAATRVPASRQLALSDRLKRMQAHDGPLPPYTLLFRDGRGIGANALALPGGSIILTDQLLDLADNDDLVLAVIGHELGHLRHRHAVRGMIQGSIVAVTLGWYAGDFSSIVVAIPVLLLQTGYSRDFEREADDYGARFLLANGMSPTALAEMLERLEKHHQGTAVPDYLSTHPDIGERAKALRNFKRGQGV